MRAQALATVLLLVLGSLPASAQDAVIQGRVYNALDSTEAVPGANVLLLQGDSLLTGTASDGEGHYRLSGVAPSAYTLQLTMIGFETTEVPLTIQDGGTLHLDVTIGRVIPEDELLFGAEEARRDLAQGEVKLLGVGLLVTSERIRRLQQKYGFVRETLGCNADPNLIQSTERYNAVVIEHLEGRNGPGWYERYWQEWEAATGR